MEIVGRKHEISMMEQFHQSGRPEFIALYGRRRVGKTYLVEQLYRNRLHFSVTGVIEGKRKDQETVFMNALKRTGYAGPTFKSWYEAFEILKGILDGKIRQGERCVLFIDELPCFDTIRAGFVKAFGDFWNDWCLKHPEVMLIVCGSATTWMIKNIIDSHGGLHNRITHEMHIHPFTLGETEQYLLSKGIEWDRLSIVQIYSVLGGIPYYLSLIDKNDSATLAVDHLFFGRDAELKNEYARLFNSLFKTPEPYMQIVGMLCKNRRGMTRDEISSKMPGKDNGHLSGYLDNLVECDFLRLYYVKDSKGKKLKKTGGIYQIADSFTIFHDTFLSSPTTDRHFWSNHLGSSKINNWYGLAFERICMYHIEQIKQALGISSISTEYYSWRSRQMESGAQIDMVIERADRIINVCEMKYSEAEYSIQKDEDMKLRNRVSAFREESGTKYPIHKTIVTTFGLKRNAYSTAINEVVTMDDLVK